MRLILGILVASACVRPTLQTCDGWTCPLNNYCVVTTGGPACVTQAALEDCAGHEDGEVCNLGVCASHACIPIVCGNGRVEPGEQCDDGNTAAGDGCSPTCQLERCGNGITDPGEECDCGDSVTAKPECSGHANSDDDVTSPCRRNCTLRRCGDGIVDPPEQCEGTVIGLTCDDFGFYSGTLTCTSFCTISTADCSSRCGDGILDAAKEQCDTVVPPEASCLSFGFYGGTLSCTSACQISTANCAGRCGDGIAEYPEDCDGADLKGATCQTLYPSNGTGTLGCSPFCRYDLYHCEGCGNGRCELDIQENATSCPGDCINHGEVCGDGQCGPYEVATCNCPADCSICAS
jgi:cysteine-rich repeat protein